MADHSIHPTDFISSHHREAVKQWIVYDGLNRMVTVFIALTDAPHGAKCGRTDYAYVGNSTRIQASKESIDTWNQAWDF